MNHATKRSARSIRKRITVLLVDDHPCVLEGVRIWLGKRKHIKVVGMAQNGNEAVLKVKKVLPGIVILDLSLPGSSGMLLMKRLQRDYPSVRVIVYSVHDESEFVQASIDAGAKGYIFKESPAKDLLLAIETVHAGGTYFGKRIRHIRRWDTPTICEQASVLKPHGLAFSSSEATKSLSSPKPVGGSNHRGDDMLVEDAIRYIKTSLSPAVSVKEIGKVLKVDPSDLERIFRRSLGVTVKKYIDSNIKEQIMNRLRKGAWKGTQLAEEFGFRSDQSFYRWIRRVFGFSYRELRERISPTDAAPLSHRMPRLESEMQDD